MSSAEEKLLVAPHQDPSYRVQISWDVQTLLRTVQKNPTKLGDVHLSLGCSQSSQRACTPSATSVFVGGRILSASTSCTQPQHFVGASAVPGRSESSSSAALLHESLPYSLKANCGTWRSAEYSCAGI